MAITRRRALGGTLALAGIAPLARPALAQGRPFAGQEVKALFVRATQFVAQQKRVAAFTERTGIRVNVTEVPFPSMREKLTAELVGNSADYDVMTVMDAWVPSLTSMFEPITPRLAAKGISLDRYPRPFVNAGTVEEQVYGLPVRASLQVLYYRKDLFDKHGLQVPSTWDAAAAAGRTIQERESTAGIAMYYGRNNGQNLMPWYNFLWTNGAEFLTPRLEPVFNSPEGLAATQRYLDLMLKDRVTPTGSASFDEQAAVTSFIQGNAAMVPVWNWLLARFSEPASALKPEQVGFAPIPTVRPGVPPTTYTNTWMCGINARSARKDAAMEFLAWVTSPELEREILLDPAEREVVTIHWSNFRDPEVNRRWNNMQMTGARALESPKVIPQFAQLPQVIDAVETAMSNAATGSATVPDAMNNAARGVQRIVSGRLATVRCELAYAAGAASLVETLTHMDRARVAACHYLTVRDRGLEPDGIAAVVDGYATPRLHWLNQFHAHREALARMPAHGLRRRLTALAYHDTLSSLLSATPPAERLGDRTSPGRSADRAVHGKAGPARLSAN